MAKSYFLSGYLFLQSLMVMGSEHTPDLRQSNDQLRCSQEVPTLEKKASAQDIRINAAYYYAGYCGNFKYDRLNELKPIPPHSYHSDCP